MERPLVPTGISGDRESRLRKTVRIAAQTYRAERTESLIARVNDGTLDEKERTQASIELSRLFQADGLTDF